MGAVLEQRRPVTAIFPSRDAMNEKIDDIKKRVSKIVDDKIREMHEERLARQEAREARKAEREQARDEKIAGKIRETMIKEAYELMGHTPEEIKKQEEIYKQMAENNQMAGDGAINAFNQYTALMNGHGMGKKGALKELRNALISGGFAAAGFELKAWLGTLEAVTALGTVPYVGQILTPVVLAAAITTAVAVFVASKKIKKEDNVASANQAHDLKEAMAQLEDLKKKIEVMTEKLNAKSTEWVEKYKKMKFQKRKFLAELKQEVSDVLKEVGLTAKESIANEIAVEIQSVVGDEVKPQKQESEVEEVKKEEKEEEEAEVKQAEQETENPEKKLTEEELQRLQENAVTELGG